MKILIVTILLLQTGICIAQNIEITVLNKNSKPMPYAYILVNNKPVEVSDTMGIAIIPMNKLKDNDTISVSYLGATPSRIIYDESLKKSKKHCFYLDESVYNLNEVVVSYQDIEKLFRKSTISISPINYNCTMSTKFDATISYSGQTAKTVSGTFEAANDIRFIPKRFFWFDRSLTFSIDMDTATQFGRALTFQTHLALYFINLSLANCQHNPLGRTQPFYSYLGEKDNNKIFRISYPPTYIRGFYYQIILYVDKNTKYIHSVEVEAVSKEPDKYNYLYNFKIKFDCELFTNKKPSKNTIYLANNVHYTYQLSDIGQFNINISDVSIIYKKF
jgi:hypothetical protein